MRSLLNALQEGRLIELPGSDKDSSLKVLANLIEAIPDVSVGAELYEGMLAREKSMNTAIGAGVACPHVRATGGGELISAVGWSPTGIDYGAPDGQKVHLVVMYYIPDAQKNVYLKEISSLVGAIRTRGGMEELIGSSDISSVRERLLDWVSAAIDASVPEQKARMIRLEARQASAEAPAPVAGGVQLVPVLILVEDAKHTILCQNAELSAALEKESGNGAGEILKQHGQFERAGYRLVFRNATTYDKGRTLYDYLAIKLG
jgi:mannitol/fructose-specific phosphotransferase system IIA component (Ntr-type)